LELNGKRRTPTNKSNDLPHMGPTFNLYKGFGFVLGWGLDDND